MVNVAVILVLLLFDGGESENAGIEGCFDNGLTVEKNRGMGAHFIRKKSERQDYFIVLLTEAGNQHTDPCQRRDGIDVIRIVETCFNGIEIWLQCNLDIYVIAKTGNVYL